MSLTNPTDTFAELVAQARANEAAQKRILDFLDKAIERLEGGLS